MYALGGGHRAFPYIYVRRDPSVPGYLVGVGAVPAYGL